MKYEMQRTPERMDEEAEQTTSGQMQKKEKGHAMERAETFNNNRNQLIRRSPPHLLLLLRRRSPQLPKKPRMPTAGAQPRRSRCRRRK
jgi:hypothetical protein